jgi:hypothetical protein
VLIESDDPDDTIGGLVRGRGRSSMARAKLGEPYLFVPAEIPHRIAREHNVVGRVRIDEVVSVERHAREVGVGKIPSHEGRALASEIARVIDLRVATERHVEFAAAVEAAEPVVADAIEKIEELGGVIAVRFAVADELLEAIAMPVVGPLVVAHFERRAEARFKPAVEIAGARTDVVEQRATPPQSESDCESDT